MRSRQEVEEQSSQTQHRGQADLLLLPTSYGPSSYLSLSLFIY